MRKPILGILGVCLMQMAFVAYTTIDLPLDASAVSAVREYAMAPAQLEQMDDTIVVHRSNAIAPKLVKTAPVMAYTIARATPKPADQPKPVRATQVFARQNPRVRTEFPVVPVGYAPTDLAYSAQVKQTKKRSFFSKAFSVVKKPYTWTRSAFEKLH